MATIIRATGGSFQIKPLNGTDFQLAELYAALNCTSIEVVATHDGNILIVDEEGKQKTSSIFNRRATEHYIHGMEDPIVGDAILCSPSQLL